MTGIILGYDPGGNGRHGVARLAVLEGEAQSLELSTHATVESVLEAVEGDTLIGAGVDTLTCWSTGHCGWRPADRWLRDRYPAAARSVASPNSLYGSMSIGGIAVLLTIRERHQEVPTTETHPKVLYRALWGRHYDYAVEARAMDADLTDRLGLEVCTSNDHEWDAAASAFAALHVHDWPHDLHQLPCAVGERLVTPCGPTSFAWPD